MSAVDLSFDVAFGPVVVGFRSEPSEAAVHGALERWLRAGRVESDGRPDLVFELGGGDRIEERETVLHDGRAWIAATRPPPRTGGARRWTLQRRDGPMLRTLGRLPMPLFRLLHVHYFSQDEVRASIVLYRHLLPALQERLLERDATLVHAAALAATHDRRSGRSLVVCGRGGAGKTSGSAALYLERPQRWRFLSDDFAVVGADGSVHFSPLPLNVFPYSTAQFEPLEERTVARMGALERLQWDVRGRLPGGKGAARRIPPPTTADPGRGPRPSAPKPHPPSVPVGLALHLERSREAEPAVEEWSPGELARTCGVVLDHELRQSRTLYDDSSLPSIAELARGCQRVMELASARAKVLRVTVPESFGARELGDLLEGIWSGDR